MEQGILIIVFGLIGVGSMLAFLMSEATNYKITRLESRIRELENRGI